MQHLARRNLIMDALRISEAKYRSLFDSLDQGILYMDAKGIVTSVNQAGEQLLGLHRDIIIGCKFVDACSKVIKEDGSIFPYEQQPLMLTLRTGKPVDDVVMGLFNREKQNYIWVVANSVPQFRVGEQQPYQVLMSLTDITSQKLVEVMHSLASVIVDNIGEGIFVTDKDKKIISVNSAFTTITGFTQQDVFGKSAGFLQSQKNSLKIDDVLSNSNENIGGWQGEIWCRHKCSEDFPSWTTVNEIKDINGVIIHYVYVFMDITLLKKAHDRMDFLAYHDPLTKLPNRLLVIDRINHALQTAQREGSKIAVLFLDLDRFKIINDVYGHSVGDSLLKEVAKRIKNLVRKEDTVSRYAGDEFIVLMENIPDTRNSAQLAQKLIETINRPVFIGGHLLQIATSVGISLFPQDGGDTDTLIKNADAAMYRAKKEGRNNYQYYCPDLTTEALVKMALDRALRQSIDHDNLILYYQPQVCLKTGKLVGVESLVRWKHPTMGLTLPQQFIPLAEENGFIVALGEWVLQNACKQMRQWLDEGMQVNKMVVNVSVVQFQRSDFVATIRHALHLNELLPSYLGLEITGSSLMDNSEQTITAINQLVALGIDVTIDDFGAGCFSLNNLKRVRVKKLKIDSSYVFHVLSNSDDEDITRSVIALAHSLHLQVIAEGIESEAQQKLLIDLGCDEGQGYLYSSPALPTSALFRQLMV
jgi:diguanylate cyclase (GGDEF)-like protein/PAS domain S-box-containing protein